MDGDGSRSRSYELADLKKLFALSRNLCAFPGCDLHLADPQWPYVTCEICHIHGLNNSARRVPGMSTKECNSYENLILLCRNHHHRIDMLEPDLYPAERLFKMKRDHESGVADTWRSDAEAIAQAVVKLVRTEGITLTYGSKGEASATLDDATTEATGTTGPPTFDTSDVESMNNQVPGDDEATTDDPPTSQEAIDMINERGAADHAAAEPFREQMRDALADLQQDGTGFLPPTEGPDGGRAYPRSGDRSYASAAPQVRDVSSSDGRTASESEEIARWPKTTAHGEARIVVDSLSAEERQTVTEVLIGLRDVDATLEDIETLDFEPHAEDEPTEQFTIKFKPHLNRLGRVVEVPAGLFDELWG